MLLGYIHQTMTEITETPYQVAPQAKIPFSLLTPREKSLLAGIILNPVGAAQRTTSGHYVSRLGAKKRVLWDREDNATAATVLGILDNSYRAA